MYDLVSVGGGLSGLAAAVFFQKNTGGRCLVLDNHAMFGGEAKRNEFLVDGQTLIAHQASAIFLVPQKGGYTSRFYDLIGMDRSAFDYQSWRGPSPEMSLSHSPYAGAGELRLLFWTEVWPATGRVGSRSVGQKAGRRAIERRRQGRPDALPHGSRGRTATENGG